jgi:hypothetical protein
MRNFLKGLNMKKMIFFSILLVAFMYKAHNAPWTFAKQYPKSVKNISR